MTACGPQPSGAARREAGKMRVQARAVFITGGFEAGFHGRGKVMFALAVALHTHTREFNAHASVETVQKSLRNDLHAAETAKRPKDA